MCVYHFAIYFKSHSVSRICVLLAPHNILARCQKFFTHQAWPYYTHGISMSRLEFLSGFHWLYTFFVGIHTNICLAILASLHYSVLLFFRKIFCLLWISLCVGCATFAAGPCRQMLFVFDFRDKYNDWWQFYEMKNHFLIPIKDLAY